ncbi:MAG: response regulator [Phototrophicaceae bacterium]
MSYETGLIGIVMAEDDEDDRLLVRAAIQQSNVLNPIEYVEDGEELMQYLRQEGKYTYLKGQPLPGLILLDLNMPRKDGREALVEIRQDPFLRHIPVVILTTSQQEDDIIRCYHLGANSYITKPVSFEGLVEVMRMLEMYWLRTVKLPNHDIN